MMSIEQRKADLIARGLTRAAERLVMPKSAPSPKIQPKAVIESTIVPEGFRRVSCSYGCPETTLQPKSEPGHRWVCATHATRETNPTVEQDEDLLDDVQVDTTPLLHYRGNLYEPDEINDNFVVFSLRNGNVVELPVSKVEWSRPPQ